ncbi:hypothetical protein IP88_15660 [alpha proteobacterium AAP81b]|nr:hypothetical protein IP88_15660 [alpha proteobacterium AAP81b]
MQQLDRASRGDNEAAIRALCATAWIGDGIALARVLGRFKMQVDTSDISLTPHLLLDGYWEMWTTEAMLQFVRPGATVVDAGANFGYFTLLMAALVGPAGRVHAFEPNPRLADIATRNVDMNGFTGTTTVHRAALADRQGSDELTVDPHYLGGGHIGGAGGGIPVALARLDAFDITPDFIKIDVEGAEALMWQGLDGILAQRRPLTCLVEWVADRYADPERFLDEMLRHGFALSRLSYDEGVLPWDRRQALAMPANAEQMLVLTR